LILVPLRLGLDSLNDIYFHSICETLQYPQSVGILGGKPRASYYFVGYQDNQLLYLDPHDIQPAVDMSAIPFPTEVCTRHCVDYHMQQLLIPICMPLSVSISISGALCLVCVATNQTFHCSVLRKLPLAEMDPSMAFGFFCKTRQDYDDLFARAQRVCCTTLCICVLR
jgi:cysteine protease ATG4